MENERPVRQPPDTAASPRREPHVPALLLRVLAEIVVGFFLLLDGIVGPVFRPIVRALSHLRAIKRLEAWIGTLHPYLILVLLAVPFGFAELTKVYAVILMAEAHFRIGMTLFISAYVVSILVCERTFHAGKGQLMKIGWFAIAWSWLMGIRDSVLAWFRSTQAWKAGVEIKARIAAAFRRGRERLRALLTPKPKGLLGRR